MAQFEELMGRMNPSSYEPTEPHLWLVGKIPTRTWNKCRQTSERKARTHSYDDLVDLLIELAMVRENDSHMAVEKIGGPFTFGGGRLSQVLELPPTAL